MSLEINRLIKDVQAENAQWYLRHRLYLSVLAVALGGWIGYSVLCFRSHIPLSPLAHFGFLAVVALFGREGIGLLSRPTRPHRHAIQALMGTSDPALVGPLLESIFPAWVAGEHLFRADKELYFAVIAALAQRLPQITETDLRMLGGREKKALYAMLKSEHREVALSAMDVVARLGDADAAPMLKKIAQQKAKTATAIFLREAAGNSLRVLQGSAD